MKQPASAPRGRGKPARRRKTREELNQESRDRKRNKKHKGNAAGSRSDVADQNVPKSGKKVQPNDPRIGSKKAVPLRAAGAGEPASAERKTAPVAPRTELSSQQELDQLESDERLDALLDRLENGETLSADEQAWLDQTLDRIDELMERLGIPLEDNEGDEQAEEDMYRLLKGQ